MKHSRNHTTHAARHTHNVVSEVNWSKAPTGMLVIWLRSKYLVVMSARNNSVTTPPMPHGTHNCASEVHALRLGTAVSDRLAQEKPVCPVVQLHAQAVPMRHIKVVMSRTTSIKSWVGQ
jgi:hypothetical protein